MIYPDRDGWWYEDKGVELYFPVVYKGRGETLQSPITGNPLRNKDNLDYRDLIEAHVNRLKKSREIKSLPHWTIYVESKKYYGNITYKSFIQHYLTEYMNMGYSDTILTPQ